MSTKRILSLVLALVMVLGTFGTVFAQETGSEKIDWLVEQGIVKGNASGNLMLDKTIDRASVAKMVVEALAQTSAAAGMQGVKSVFPDVPVNFWSNGNINVVNGLGLMKGNAKGQFMPTATISYNEVITILVRMAGGITAEEEKTAVWPATYIAKANQLGLLEGLTATNFAADAIRKDILELFYNAMMHMQVGNYSVVKGLVIENNRVETIGKEDIVIEVIKEVQVANYANASRYEKGDNVRITLPAKVGNVENLLGKVVDVTIDKNNTAHKVTVDNGYLYVQGAIEATKSKLDVDGTVYTVEMEERYKDKDERIFRTYHNDKAYSYEDFYQDPATIKDRKRADSFEADFARVTIKNGKVLFIDSFTFDDIAPVQEVKKDGAEVYVYNDQRDARIEKYSPKTVIAYTEKDGFERIEKADIKVNDVIHVYNENKLIVRQDAKVDGTYEKVSEGTRGKFFVHVDGEKYFMNTADYRKPVYSYDSKEFMTLIAKDAERDLREFKGENVTVLKDINGDLQYIGSNIDFKEGIAIIDDILSRGDVRYIKANDEKVVLTETFDSKLVINGTTKNQRMSEFNRGDLVFVVNDDDKIDVMNRLATRVDVYEDAIKVEKDSDGDFVMNKDYIKLVNGDRFNLLDKTNVFIVNVEKDGLNYKVTRIEGTTVADVAKNAKSKTDLRALILSDRDFDLKDVNNRSRTSGRTDIAHTVIFTDYTGVSAKLDKEVIKVSYRFIAGLDKEIEGKDADGNTIVRKVDRDAKLPKIEVGDIVELGITKDDDKIVMDATVKIPYNAKTFRVTDMDSRTAYRWIELTDANGLTYKKYFDKDLWISRDVIEFGKIALNDSVSFTTNTAGDIIIIQSHGRKAPTGTWDGKEVPTKYAKLERVYKLADQIYVRIDNKDYKYVGLQTIADLLALEGKYVDYKEIDLDRNEVGITRIWEPTPEVPEVDKTALTAALNTATAKVKGDYTTESWDAFQTALIAAKALPETTQTEVNAKVDAITAAIAKLDERTEEVDGPKFNFGVFNSVVPGKKMVVVTFIGTEDPTLYNVKVAGVELDYNESSVRFQGTVNEADALESNVVITLK